MKTNRLMNGALLALLIFSTLALLFFPLASLNVAAASRTIVVPDEYPTIQSAVDNANAGDTIFVRNGTYVENVVVNRTLTIIGENISNTIVDGNGAGSVFAVSASRVKISNFKIQGSKVGYPNSGIRVVASTYCVFKDNVLTSNYVGVSLSSSYLNLVERNLVLGAYYGVYLLDSPGNTVTDNSVLSGYAAVLLFSSSNCLVIGNNIENNTSGMTMSSCSGNIVYYNNFIGNPYQTILFSDISSNTWDNGYPAGGNYWSNYRGRDLYKGQYQNITGSDGIGDVPYVMRVDNVDRFPFMDPVSVFHDVAVVSVIPSALRAYQGQMLNISVVVANLGNYTESFSVSLYCVGGSGETLIGTRSVANLAARAEIALTFEWDTVAVMRGDYTMRAEASAVEGEKDLANNVLYDGTVAVTERFHDVAVVSVVPSALKVYQGQVLSISVVVANVGNFTETFDVTAYYDESVIGQQNVASLGIGGGLTLVYSWNTTGVEPDREYLLRAMASSVPGEVNLDNNMFVYGFVKVRSFTLGAIKITQLVPSDHLGNPVTSFSKGAISYFKVAVNNTSVDSEVVLVTVNVYDSLSASLGVVSFKGLIMPGISVFILGLPIPNTAHSGTAGVYANTFTDWPFAGGLPYGPEKSATFQILG